MIRQNAAVVSGGEADRRDAVSAGRRRQCALGRTAGVERAPDGKPRAIGVTGVREPRPEGR